MIYSKEFDSMHKRIFNKELIGKILSDYDKELDRTNLEEITKNYLEASDKLNAIFNKNDKGVLAAMESEFALMIKPATSFGFTRGLYVGFQQMFVENTAEFPFFNFVEQEILTLPQMKKYPDYYSSQTRAKDLFETLLQKSNEETKEQLTSIYTAWDNQIFGILRHSYYFGYRYALSIVRDVESSDSLVEKIKKILSTEKEVIATNTRENDL